MSGGQRQRVAMGRAIVRSPKAFLMDEPLSNLDAKLRVQMRTMVSKLQQRLQTTTVYVTHDQTEAMTLGDRIVVMRGGMVQQIGSPQDLYDTPANLFVAGFIGSPAMNFLPAKLEEGKFRTALGDLAARPTSCAAAGDGDAPREVIVGIRPEHFEDAALVEDQQRSPGLACSPPRSTCWSRWARTSSPTSASRASRPCPTTWPISPPTRARRTCPAATAAR